MDDVDPKPIPEMHAHHNSLHNQQRRGLLNVAVGNTSELSHMRVCVRRVPVAEKIAVSTVGLTTLTTPVPRRYRVAL